MSYNPAFVGDGDSSTSDNSLVHENDYGVKLKSYKQLTGADQSGLYAQKQLRLQNKETKKCPFITNQLPLLDSSRLNLLDVNKSVSVNQQNFWSSSPNSVTKLSQLCAAVECRKMYYHIGRGSNKRTILHDINITVPEGTIYGLLGPSGCGKTTMLRCVVGQITPKLGTVKAFGFRPNENGSQIPGSAIGYMPQEIAVQKYFTINEALKFYGKIHGMKKELIDARIEFLVKFLDLPDKDRIMEHLSGGQKRRVSLAVALVHSPPLLILDEPTVGVDPLLRQSIWKHLVFLAQTEKITIIVTTHYIEEARQANVVGLMRHGRLLIEDSPDNLMAQFKMDNLEDVFLKLCISDSSIKASKLATQATKKKLKPNNKPMILDANGLPILHDGGITLKVDSATNKTLSLFNYDDNANGLRKNCATSDPTEDNSDADYRNENGTEIDFIVNKNNLRSMIPGTKYAPNKMSISNWTTSFKAIVWKNCVRIKRNPPLLLFEFLLPSVQLILFCLCIGGDPFDIPLAVVNDETIPFASKYFLDAIDKHTIRQIPYSNLSSAIESVRRGETWGAIHIPDRYTQHLQDRLINPSEFNNETMSNATINIYPDMTNLHLALAMENSFRKAFIKFAKDTLNMFGYDPGAAELPIRVEEPIYGTLKTDGFLDFMAPGVVISMTYVMAAGLTALVFILERRDGLLERSLVSGVTTTQVLLAHTAVQVVVMTMQISLVLTFKFLVFKIPSNGPFIWVISLILLQGCAGMSFGLFISSLCREENTAVMMLVGTFYTNLMLAGIIWPIAAMPRWIRWFSYIQPQTLAVETLRNVLSRGWSIDEPGVYLGFLMTIGWLIVFLFSAALAMRYLK